VPAPSIEFCREDDLNELFARFADWYRYNPRLQERAYFDWQFRDAPNRLADAGYDYLLLRDTAGAITGCLGFTGFEFRIDDEIRLGGWTHNWMAPNQGEAGLALLWRFMQLVDNRFLLRLNDKSASVTKLLRVPMLAAMPRWWAAIDAERVAALFKFGDADDRDRLAGSAATLERAASGPEAERLQRFAPEEEFDLRSLGAIGFARRTGRYLNWRYRDIPNHNYRFLRRGPGFAVYRVEPVMHTNVSVVRLLEWGFGRAETGGALATILADAAAENPVLIDFQGTFAATGAVLAEAGFVPQDATAAPMPDLFRPTFNSGGYAVAIDLPPHRQQRTVDFDRWYITSGDSDIDRVKL
jgi:hypothetical protein